MAVCEPLIFPVSSVKEVARHPYSTRDCFILLIFQSKTAHCGFLARQAWQTSLAGGKYSGLSSTSSGRGYLFFTQKGKNYVIAWRKAYPFQGGGGEGAAAPPFFWSSKRKFAQSQFLTTFSCFLFTIIIIIYFFIFHVFFFHSYSYFIIFHVF